MPQGEQNHIVYFAETNFRNKRVKFGIRSEDRRRHIHLIGKTGMGKTTILENMVLDDIQAGRGLCYIDPHGDSVEKFLDFIPTSRINDVVYFNPSDLEYPVAFNMLETVNPDLKHIVASGLVAIFKKLWADTWGPRLEYLLRNAILALLDSPGSTLLGIMRILTDKAYRQKVIEKVKDPMVKSFWVDEFSRYPDKFQVEAISPIQNKVGQFLSNFLIRNIVGQVKSTFDIRQIMDEGKILLLNLSKGRMGEDTSALLGAMMITQIQLAAMGRVNTPEEERKDFYLYVDEFQNFATESFATILSEARKYHLNLVIAHQYIEQLNEDVAAAVFGNVGTIVCFRVGAADAEVLVKEFTPVFTEEDMVNLGKYEIYLRLLIDGVASEPFSARGLPPLDRALQKTGNAEKIIRVSRERYARSRSSVEEKIVRWATGAAPVIRRNALQDGRVNTVEKGVKDSKREMREWSDTKTGSIKEKRVAFSQDREKLLPQSQYLASLAQKQAVKGLREEVVFQEPNPNVLTPNRPYPAQCYSCNQLTYVSFVPDGKRPVYCKVCLRDVHSAREKERKTKAIEFQQQENAQPPISSILVQQAPVSVKKKLVPENRVGEEMKKQSQVQETKRSKGRSVRPGEVVRF